MEEKKKSQEKETAQEVKDETLDRVNGGVYHIDERWAVPYCDDAT